MMQRKADGGIHTVVYPPGAIGGVLAACLPLKHGDQLTVISRSHAGLLSQNGVASCGVAGNHWKSGGDFCACTSLADVKIPIDRLLLAAPTYALGRIAEEISSCLAISEKTRVFLLNNGLLEPNPIAHFVPAQRLYNAVVMVGAFRRSPNVMEVTVNAGITIGSLSGALMEGADDLAGVLTVGGLPSRTTPNIGKEIFRKLGFNNVGALSAVHKMPLGGLLMPQFTASVNRIAAETWKASIDAGYKSFDTESEAIADVSGRIHMAERHTASITKALLNKQKTEIDSLCGAVVSISLANGWFAEECARVWEEIRTAEKDNRAQNVLSPKPELAGAAAR